MNRLSSEKSPYLLQHAHNPVDWYPWGEEAFEKARQTHRPILLSIGYSTCHWCHVMENESFEDHEIAQFMNENYVCIKVDREERPDLDAIYMSAVQTMTGSGGWPMTVWLNHDGKPFFGGTYFPPRDGDRGARTGFLTLLEKLHEVFNREPERVKESSHELSEVLKQILTPQKGDDSLPTFEAIEKTMAYYKNRFDHQYGGLSGSPKFPSSLSIRLLLRQYARTHDPAILKMAVLTLKKMAEGGMYDQVGGGFHRYSTDSQWLVPHFEKMLYDNALLVTIYIEAYQITQDKDFERIAKETLQYVQRDMTSPEEAFYSATDADSRSESGEFEEGPFFTWTLKELQDVLGKEDAEKFSKYFGVTERGNFEGRNILFVSQEPPQDEWLKTIKQKLYEARLLRPKPLRDEKILTAWNGLMISAFAKAGSIKTAEKAAEFLWNKLYKNKNLHRSYKDGEAYLNGYLDDYAFFIAALLDLFEVTRLQKWIDRALELDKILETDFEDEENGGFFMTGKNHEKLLAREKPSYDGAEPSGNSVTLMNLLRLNKMTAQDEFRVRAEKLMKAFSMTLSNNPISVSEMLLAVDHYLTKGALYACEDGVCHPIKN